MFRTSKKKSRRSLIDWSLFAIGKGESRDAKVAREEREFSKAREIARCVAYKRAGGCCQRCGTRLVLQPSKARHEFEIAHAHEEPPRSKGGDPTNPRDIVILCFKCHDQVTTKKLAVVFVDPVLKADGRVEFVPKESRWREQSAGLGT